MTAPTVLFQAHNRRGLGHLMRSLNLAREVLCLQPGARVLVHTRTAADDFCPPGVTCLVQTDAPSTWWPQVLAGTAPDLVVYDTIAPADPSDEAVPEGSRIAMVLRKSRPERHAEIVAGGFLDRCDAVVVPHTAEEFDLPLPAGVAARTRFVGPVARRPDPRVQDALRQRYGLRPGEPLLVSTAGGGGFSDSAARFAATVEEVHRALAALPAPVRHVVVLGPQHAGPVPVAPGARLVTVEPALVDLFALADLVVSEGGYNSVSELRVVGTPAVFTPGRRRYDDQHERVRALAATGTASVVADETPGAVAAEVTRLLRTPALLTEMRARAAAAPVPLGNRAAAEHLLGPLLRRAVA